MQSRWLACGGATVISCRVYFSMEKPKPVPQASIGMRLKEFEAAEVERIISSFTRCGKCYEVCPMAQYSRAPAADGKAVVRGVLAVLRGEAGSEGALGWSAVCARN